jgi:hypothetical protein
MLRGVSGATTWSYNAYDMTSPLVRHGNVTSLKIPTLSTYLYHLRALLFLGCFLRIPSRSVVGFFTVEDRFA